MDQVDIVLGDPIQGELVWAPDNQGILFFFQEVKGIDPEREALIGELLSQSAFQLFPNFCHGRLEFEKECCPKKADLDSRVPSTQEGGSLSTVMIPREDLARTPFLTIIKSLKRRVNLAGSARGPERKAGRLPGGFISQFRGFAPIPGWCINVSTFFDLSISLFFVVFCFFPFPCALFFRLRWASPAPSKGFALHERSRGKFYF